MGANARFDAAVRHLLDMQDAIAKATTERERETAYTLRNDAMMTVTTMYTAEHAACKRAEKALREATR